jgi:hypothetical protein
VAKKFKPAHRALATFTRGRVRFACVCGWQSRVFPDGKYREGFATYEGHAGLRERPKIGVKGGDN